MWGLRNDEFEALSVDNIFELNDGWSGLERILLTPIAIGSNWDDIWDLFKGVKASKSKSDSN